MDEYRDYKVVLREAELLSSSPETVADWLRDHIPWSETDPTDDRLEANLLARQERVIDLALARYGTCGSVLQDLFAREDEVLRAAALSNENVYQGIDFPGFLDMDRQLNWLSGLSEIELQALFSNPKLASYQIKKFFSMEGAWQVLSESQRKTAAWCIVNNMMKWTDTFSVFDWGTWENTRLEAIGTAYAFADLVEMTPPWPAMLARLYAKLGEPSSINFDPLKIAVRWTTSDDEDDTKKENQKGNLTTHQEVRCGLGRLAAAKARGDIKKLQSLLQHRDVAIRCGAYLVAHLSSEQVDAACKKDKYLACSHLIQNEHIWRYGETRDLLEEACRKVSKGEEWIITVLHGFHRQRDLMTEAHPDWFEEKNWQDDDVAEKPLTESSVGEIVEQIATSPAFIALTAKVEATSKEGTYRFWVVMAILVVIAFQI
jgi:hypothetical protein